MQFHPLVDEIYQALKSKLAHDLEGKGTVRISAAPDQSSGTLYFEEEQNQKSHIDKKYQKNTKTPTKSTFLTANLIQNIKKITQDPLSKIHGVSWKDREGNLQHWGKNENLFSQIPHAASSFVQAHQQGNQALIQKVVKACANHKGVIEIYAGSGNFTIPIAQMYSNPTIDSQNKTKKRTAVTAFEWDSEAVDQLRVMTFEQKLDLSVTNIKDEGVNEKIFAQDGYDCLLMDPPRAGANEIIQKLKQLKHQSIQTKLKKIVYVSCHAPALCRDLKDLLMLGEWKIKRLQLFNLFPHTGHIEVFCEITR
jgi:tRNA/tmRNA/rRNA uracil-C5-methylase (TrmA/RlmC/RlmD family)